MINQMTTNSQKVQRFIIAACLASGLVSVGVAASAQTTATPAAMATANATTVSTASVNSKAQRQAQLDELNADERRVDFLHLGTSL
jgi:hypothetical protein